MIRIILSFDDYQLHENKLNKELKLSKLNSFEIFTNLKILIIRKIKLINCNFNL